jgi:hypothetical protein
LGGKEVIKDAKKQEGLSHQVSAQKNTKCAHNLTNRDRNRTSFGAKLGRTAMNTAFQNFIKRPGV